MSRVSLIHDPFGLSPLGVPEEMLPDRWVVASDDRPRMDGRAAPPHANALDRWELPAPVVPYFGATERLRISVGNDPPSLHLSRTPSLPTPTVAARAFEHEGTVIGNARVVEDCALRLSEAISSYGHTIHRLLDLAPLHTAVIENRKGDALWFPSRVVAEELIASDDSRVPPIWLIVKLAERLAGTLQDLFGSLRRMLRRRRRLVPVGLAQIVDAGCIQWLARQPGRTLQERAGPSQRVLSIVRQDTVDTFENRVLKQCLNMCAEEASRYLRIFQRRFPGQDRVDAVRRLQRQAIEMLSDEEFDEVGEVGDDSRPNYALQFERRYSEIWWAYQALMKRRREEDELWRWRHRIWSEILLLDFGVAAETMVSDGWNREDRELGLLRDPQQGFWLHPASRFPKYPMVHVGKKAILQIVAPLHELSSTRATCAMPVDIEITIQREGEITPRLLAQISGFGAPLPRVHVGRSGPLRLAIFPHGGHESNDVKAQHSAHRGESRVISWPTWGRERVACARDLLFEFLDLIPT